MKHDAEGSLKLLTPQDILQVMQNHEPRDVLLLDLRVFAQYSKSRLHNALNLCIPTTLLKRASYNVQRLAETFANKKEEKAKFNSWRDTQIIITYDATSSNMDEATSCSNILMKFINEKWQGAAYILKGGYNAFAKTFPDEVDSRSTDELEGAQAKKLSLDPPSAAPVAGGCAMPPTQHAANPFFGTIRQNMDLIDGVGQIPLKRPASLMDVEEASRKFPKWLADASDSKDEGKIVAERFLTIERAEQRRMQKALSTENWKTQRPLQHGDSASSPTLQVAGIEKGTKNRYKDILPYDHARVRLQNHHNDCDYINASHIRSERAKRHYIACQAPVPSTFTDFWQLIWEQDVQTIIMLTAESEGGQTKSHPYWVTGEYGPFTLRSLSTKSTPLNKYNVRKASTPSHSQGNQKSKPLLTAPNRLATPGASYFSPPLPTRSAQSPSATPSAPRDVPSPAPPSTTIRTLALTHSDHPFAPMRQITQIHYASWPDFGATASPRDLLGLVELCQGYLGDGEGRPSVVHCSAGCGRTGTFCTVDCVLGVLAGRGVGVGGKRGEGERKEDDGERDLVAETVEEFRRQRLSMVQTLRQFVLCYEAVMESFV